MSKSVPVAMAAVVASSLLACPAHKDPVSSPAAGPRAVSMIPAPGTSYVVPDQVFSVAFSDAMDEASVEAAYRVAAGGQVVDGRFAWHGDGTAIALAPGSEITVTWGHGMRGRNGQLLRAMDGLGEAGFTFRCQVYTPPRQFASNGEQIYFTGTSASGEPILFTMGEPFAGATGYGAATGQWSDTRRFGRGTMGMGSGMMGTGGHGMACAACHGADGSGGCYLAMGTVVTPGIRYAVLTSPETHSDGHEHEPYADEDILRAILDGVAGRREAGRREAGPVLMPRWHMSAGEAQSLLEFLRCL